jgi:hypothetical protein
MPSFGRVDSWTGRNATRENLKEDHNLVQVLSIALLPHLLSALAGYA